MKTRVRTHLRRKKHGKSIVKHHHRRVMSKRHIDDRFRYDENGRYYECRFCPKEFPSQKERDHHERLCEWTEKDHNKIRY
jgi:hypothetical protein